VWLELCRILLKAFSGAMTLFQNVRARLPRGLCRMMSQIATARPRCASTKPLEAFTTEIQAHPRRAL